MMRLAEHAATKLTAGIATSLALLTPLTAVAETCGDWTQVDPPADAGVAFTDVEARSATDAYALDATWGLAHWDGTAWDPFPIDDLFGDYPIVWIDKIGLTGPSHLFLAGRGDTGPFSNDQLLKIWDGSGWSDWHSLTLEPAIGGAPRNGAATAVAGAAIDDVWIVGRANGIGAGGGELPLTVHWDGSQLTEFMTPGVADTQNPLFDAVAIATDDVWAVGHYFNVFDPPFGFRAVTYHWDGSSWSPIPNAAEAFEETHLYTVTAIASDDVWAAGGHANRPLFIHWDGTEWTIVPAPATTGTIYGITAIASDDVWAVDFAAQVPVIGKFYHWDGVEWSIVLPPEIPGATTVNRHGGLTAAGECDVWAVGSIDTGPGLEPFIEHLGPDVVAVPIAEPDVAFLEVSPNPMHRSTRIRSLVPGVVPDRAEIFNSRGRRVRTLLGSSSADGLLVWDARNDAGEPVAIGVYFVRLRAMDGRAFTQKLTVMH